MSEEALFAAALEKPTPEERAAFLAAACGDDVALRQRVEALLDSHEHGGEFLKTPAIQLAAGASSAIDGDTELNPNGGEHHDDNLSFLATSQQPGSLGRLGHYEVQEVIGRGGMGIVLRALDERLHRVAAIKVMAAQLATSATARKRFTREAQAAAAVTHDHIVTIYAVDEAAGLPYLAMQYIAGVSLQQRIDCSGPLQLEEILRIGMQTASGLAAAHAQGLIHRDIKPANILLENGVERVKITDFGLARAADDANLTQSGIVAGTPHYMSPEQAQGTALDQRSDLFSLGSVLYAMCTGRAPFRASGTVAVLKRVCEEIPSPVHEINAAIPTWLSAIIEKLHAKDPAERYQSAAEVAEVFGRHLAHVQHPSVIPLPYAVSAPTHSEPAQRISLPNRSETSFGTWWTVAGVLLVLLFGGLSLTEATGVTRLVPTVIRVLTPDGTLVVETDDPAVNVTIEGDGGLSITGAGPHEVRLKPGSYKLQATKKGQPVALDQELVTITRGGKEVVRVKLEAAARAVVAPKAELGAFVLLGGKDVELRKYGTLAEAVQNASDGDTIEIRGNGPFVTDPIAVREHALTVRAAGGFRPVVRLSERGAQTYDPVVSSAGPLVLEGIEFRRLGQKSWQAGAPRPTIIECTGPSLHVACCIFRTDSADMDEIRSACNICVVRQSAFLGPCTSVLCTFPATMRLSMDNCVHLCRIPLCMFCLEPNQHDVEIRLARNTLVAVDTQAVHFGLFPHIDHLNQHAALKPVEVEAAHNVIDARCVLVFGKDAKPLDPREDEALLQRTFSWRDQGNVYLVRGSFMSWSHKLDLVNDRKTLVEWKQLWDEPDAAGIEGRPRYLGGDLASRLSAGTQSVTPDDFRLRPDSAGYRAGPDGKDLGAEVELVGPGAAYERWKKTSEYQQWRKDTEQLNQ